jgi:hypothetical protein
MTSQLTDLKNEAAPPSHVAGAAATARAIVLCCTAVCLSALFGCMSTDASENDETDGVEVAVVTSALSMPTTSCASSTTCSVRWGGGFPGTEVCVMGGVSGGDSAGGATYDLWKRPATAESSEFFEGSGDGYAICVKRARFTLPSGGSLWTSSDALIGYHPLYGNLAGSAELWQGDAATALVGVGRFGQFASGNDRATITQAFDPYQRSKITLTLANGGPTPWARGRSLFAGVPSSGSLPELAFCGSNTTNCSDTFEFKAKAGHNQHVERKLSRTDTTLCYFTEISGYYIGGGEWAAITPKRDFNNIEWWYLVAHAQNGIAGAKARCIFLDQTL